MCDNEIEDLTLRCNKLAMEYLKAQRFKDSFALLSKAETVLKNEEEVPNRLKLLSITYNNLACFYKRKKQLKLALKYALESLELEKQIEENDSELASTHLNLCAIYSAMNKHSTGLEHAQEAIGILEKTDDKSPQVNTNGIIAFYNCGAELEHLHQKEEALKYYEIGYKKSVIEFGEDNQLTQSFAMVIEKLNQAISAEQQVKRFRESVYLKSKREVRTKLPFLSPMTSKKSSVLKSSRRLHRTSKSFFV
ncbi:hypothetical protein SteCoe_11437 [Stentor coeruleus]|uniref:MalT-like TPR region domain-containing protein n=1 Tax=Stentor coeruleus TaxID=5963 RepID=A0A1R2CD62_9CILI|nr:hypothetical protein SteCoe_11437 [Stentor coeruleus]